MQTIRINWKGHLQALRSMSNWLFSTQSVYAFVNRNEPAFEALARLTTPHGGRIF
nr:hypothetical protein [uncultured Arsenicibacter sp.]